MPDGRFPVGRRPVMLATAALVAGCDALPASSTDPSSAPATTTTDTPTGGDDALTARVREELAVASALAAAIAQRFPNLRGLADPYAALHRSHGAMLGAPPQADAPRVTRERARRDLLRQERRLQDELVDAAVAAESGALAQALAAMAAAIAQQREATP